MLTDKQERFAQAYVLHRNATEAAKAAAKGAASFFTISDFLGKIVDNL